MLILKGLCATEGAWKAFGGRKRPSGAPSPPSGATGRLTPDPDAVLDSGRRAPKGGVKKKRTPGEKNVDCSLRRVQGHVSPGRRRAGAVILTDYARGDRARLLLFRFGGYYRLWRGVESRCGGPRCNLLYRKADAGQPVFPCPSRSSSGA
ncbi:MAG: hypothetical protein OXH69_12360 [Acidobacteria bacterium]|nr:hypothetical protein [Acidobacteriota bacterium]